MPNVFRSLLDKSSKFHPRHKKSPSTNTPAVNTLGQLSKLNGSSSTLAADSPSKLLSPSSPSGIAYSNHVSPSLSDLDLDRPNLLLADQHTRLAFATNPLHHLHQIMTTPRSRCTPHLAAIPFWAWLHPPPLRRRQGSLVRLLARH
jgi:hypothetical protein